MKNILRSLLILSILCLIAGSTFTQSDEGEVGMLRNPLNGSAGADPWLTYYEGFYYLATTTGASHLTMQKADTLAGLQTAEVVTIYTETEPDRCCNMWAPEFHLLEGPNGLRWYYYYSAGTDGTLDNQRTHVLESEGLDPMGPYTYKARVYDATNDGWVIDGSILKLEDKLYSLTSTWVNENQTLFIAPMSDPWTVSGSRALLARPDQPWERNDGNVTEGPVALYHEDKVYIIYSASGCWTSHYKLGMLTYNGGDPLSTDSWVKNPEPVFQTSDETGVYGPGHNGFFKSPDGTEDWIVYHANDSAAGVCDQGRTTRVQKFTWNEDGTPNFGLPVSMLDPIAAPSGDTGTSLNYPDPLVISRFRSAAFDDAYLRHVEESVRVDQVINPLADSQFIVLPGLADPDAVSIEAVNAPNHFLRVQGNAVVLAPNDGTDAFKEEATWRLSPGLADETLISIEAYSQPGKYIGKMFGVMALVAATDSMTDTAKEDATFLREE